ncbi:MAG: hypothetical protein JXJ04_08345 [Spirochaetales bacterium]|nr:hypothetical protein [Spirochaetales bacterium]
MNQVIIDIPEVKSGELVKLLSFISEDVINVEIKESKVVLDLLQDADNEQTKKKAEKIIGKYLKEAADLQEPVTYLNKSKKVYSSPSEVYNSKLIKNIGDGILFLKSEAVVLYKYFDDIFKKLAIELGAIEKFYPVLLPIDSYKKTGYLLKSPQYAIFCCSPKEDIDNLERMHKLSREGMVNESLGEPQYALSPAACFHSYLEYENCTISEPLIITFNQSVFRHEGRFNWKDFARLKDYHVREIVFFGSPDYVDTVRRRIMEETKQILERLDLDGRICLTSDPFVVPAFQKYKRHQLAEECKYELQLSYSSENYIAVASFNVHGNAFTGPFNIKINDCQKSVTGCVGFGIERWILAFLAQYGLNPDSWPSVVTSNLS